MPLLRKVDIWCQVTRKQMYCAVYMYLAGIKTGLPVNNKTGHESPVDVLRIVRITRLEVVSVEIFVQEV
jgi:hypothetical protein